MYVCVYASMLLYLFVCGYMYACLYMSMYVRVYVRVHIKGNENKKPSDQSHARRSDGNKRISGPPQRLVEAVVE